MHESTLGGQEGSHSSRNEPFNQQSGHKAKTVAWLAFKEHGLAQGAFKAIVQSQSTDNRVIQHCEMLLIRMRIKMS